MTNGYSIQDRLKGRKVITELFAQGKSFNCYPLRVIYKAEKNDVAALKCGVSVSKRHFKKAVDRNRIKRLLREAWRTQNNPLKILMQEQGTGLYVFINYVDKEMPGFDLIKEKVMQAVKRMTEKVRADAE